MKTSVFVKKESEKNMEDKMKQALLECCELGLFYKLNLVTLLLRK